MQYRIALEDIADVKPCMDPSLPAGHAFWVSLRSLPTGLYFSAGRPPELWLALLNAQAQRNSIADSEQSTWGPRAKAAYSFVMKESPR